MRLSFCALFIASLVLTLMPGPGLAQEKWARGERLDGLLEHYGREVSQSRVPSD